MKRIYLFIFVLIQFQAYSQFMSVPVRNTIHTPHGNVHYTSYQSMPMYYGGGGIVNNKYKFTIVMKNDSSFTARTKINLSQKVHTIAVKNKDGEKTISPIETKEISRDVSTGVKLVGIPTDSCWLFKSHTGRINTYSSVAELGTSYAIAFQKGNDGPIKPITKENLLEAIGDDPKLKKKIEKGKLINAIDAYNWNNGKH